MTVKCGKTPAAVVNAVAYGLYTYIMVLTMCDLPMFTKCITVALCNFIGVWVVKYGEEKARKDKLWKVEMTIPPEYSERVHTMLQLVGIPHNYIDVEKYVLFNCYCATQKESTRVKTIANDFNVKYFVSESKNL